MFDGDKIVANLSTTDMVWLMKGKKYRAIQVGTVMTDEAYRGQGINSQLMRKAIKDNEAADLMFLFADEDAIPYYEKYGFKAYAHYNYSLSCLYEKGSKIHLIAPVDVEDVSERKSIMEAERNAFKNELYDVLEGESLLMWYLVNFYRENIYYIEELETYVIYSIEDGRLELYKVITKTPYLLELLLDYILDSEIKEIIFHFTPSDNLCYTVTKNEEAIFIRSQLESIDVKRFPTTAKA